MTPDRSPDSRAPTAADEPAVHEIRFFADGPVWVATIGDGRRSLTARHDHPFEAVKALVRLMYNYGWEV